MSTPTLDQVLKQARHFPAHEFRAFCDTLTSALYTSSAAECISPLRQLFLLLHTSHLPRSLPQQLIDGLVKLLLVQDGSKWLTKLLSALILSELAPSGQINLPMGNLPWDDTQVPYVLSVALGQAPIKEDMMSALLPQLIKWVSTVGYSAVVQGRTLAAVEAIARLQPDLLTKEHIHIINSQMADWLKNASLQQAQNPYARGIFRKDTENLPNITELDGLVTKSFFTALCVGKYYTSDQLMNIHTFSTARLWLHKSGHMSLGSDTGSNRSSRASTPSYDREDRSVAAVSAGSLPEACLQYALRVIEQCDRKPKMPTDVDLQRAALMEAISLLDQLCSRDPSLIPRVFETAKRVYNQVGTSQPRVFVRLLQFFLNHSEAVVYDPSQAYETFFKTLGQLHHRTALTFDAVMFVQENLSILCEIELTQKYFPSLLKALAWNPRSFISEYVSILPACLSPTTTLEVLHRLLDLPCLTATLELSLRAASKSESSSNTQGRPPTIPQKCINAFKEGDSVFIFKYVLRAEGGFGDTIDKLNHLHEMLSPMRRHPRVVCCAEAVPPLLQTVLEVVLDEGDEALANSVLQVLLERSGLLYNIPEYKTQVRSVLAWSWKEFVKKYPNLLTEQHGEVLDFISSTRNLTEMEDFFLHVLWSIGEFLSPRFSSSCSPEVLVKSYETLETVAYEVAQSPAVRPSARLITALMSAAAKLASRSQDLIPRAVLCVSKLGQLATSTSANFDSVSSAAIKERTSELMSIMKLPNIAAMVLSPPSDMDNQRWHLDNTKLPIILQTTNNILQSQTPVTAAGSVPSG